MSGHSLKVSMSVRTPIARTSSPLSRPGTFSSVSSHQLASSNAALRAAVISGLVTARRQASEMIRAPVAVQGRGLGDQDATGRKFKGHHRFESQGGHADPLLARRGARAVKVRCSGPAADAPEKRRRAPITRWHEPPTASNGFTSTTW